jgi:peroxiredoxin
VIFLAAAAFVWRAVMADAPTTAPTTALQFQGKVVDAQTGKPIAAFRLLPGFAWGAGLAQTQWQRGMSKDASNGTYEFVPRTIFGGSDVSITYTLRIEADGYEPATSPACAPDGKAHTYDFALKPGKNVEGIVLTPAGQPAANARVTLVLPGELSLLEIGQAGANRANLQSTSDAHGKFSFFPQTGNYAVVAFGDSGWAQVDQDGLGKSGTVKLQPWGRVEGVAMIGRKAAAQAEVVLQWGARVYDPAQPTVSAVDRQTTDEQGKFAFDRVPAGQLTICRKYADGHVSATDPVNVQAGQTVAVQLGGKGRSIIGHVVKPEGVKSSRPQCQGYLRGQSTPLPPPAELLAAGKKVQQTMADPEMSPQQKETWLSQWTSSAEGQAYQTAMNAYQQSLYQTNQPVMLSIAADGSFRADDVPPGKYQLTIYQVQVSEGGSSRVYAMIERQVTVSGRSDDPLDLGQLKLTLSTPPAGVAETPAISFEAKTLDGKIFKLADHRGAYVLLDLWATWTPLSDTRLAALNDTFAAFRQNKKFVMIGLGAGDSVQDVTQFAQQHAMPWMQASLDEPAAQSIADMLGVNSLPAVVLVGPDGKVIAAGLRGPGIRTAVQEALNAP